MTARRANAHCCGVRMDEVESSHGYYITHLRCPDDHCSTGWPVCANAANDSVSTEYQPVLYEYRQACMANTPPMHHNGACAARDHHRIDTKGSVSWTPMRVSIWFKPCCLSVSNGAKIEMAKQNLWTMPSRQVLAGRCQIITT